MTGSYLAKLMQEKWLNEELAKHARRYSKRVENQEEYIQDAWLRIAEHQENMDLDYYAEQGRKAIYNIYHRQYRKSVAIDKRENGNGISVTEKDEKPPPKRAIKLYKNKYLDPRYETIDWQYYEGQEDEMKADAEAKILHDWYNKYDGFESLDSHEKNRVIGKFLNSGYNVGMPVGATPGKKARIHRMYAYSVDRNGVVEKSKAPRETHLDRIYAEPGGQHQGIDMSSWYKLRSLGGSDDWIEYLDETIEELERY